MIRFLPFGVASLLAAQALGAGPDLGSATNQLGWELYRRVAEKQPKGNLALSPYSLENALALAFAGADGTTREEMARVLHLPPDDPALALAFAELKTGLASATASFDEWHVADRLFGQTGYPFRTSFLDLLSRDYGAPFVPLDFRSAAEQARATINSWVEDQTEHHIADLIPPGGVDPHTRLVLADALYLKAHWALPFPKKATRKLPFRIEGAARQDVPTMSIKAEFGYRRENGLTAVAVPYAGGEVQFLILLPDAEDGTAALGAALTSDQLRRYADLPAQEMTLYLPKFRLDGGALALGSELRELGMKTAFDQPRGSAHFDRIAPRTPEGYLALSEVFQKVFVALDETGTEAAAGTGVVVLHTFGIELHPHPLIVRVDHPFLFAIQDCRTGLCLFLGRVADPRGLQRE